MRIAMKLTIEPTAEIMQIEGQRLRRWEGLDEAGTPVHVYVRYVEARTHDPARLQAFDAQLKELPPLRAAGMVIDYRFIAGDEVEHEQ